MGILLSLYPRVHSCRVYCPKLLEYYKMNNLINEKNFTTKLSAIGKSARTMRDNAQSVLDFGFLHYVQTGDSGYLSRIANACIGIKALNTAIMIAYIEDTANIKQAKLKDGARVFKKIKGDSPTVKTVRGTWYDFEQPEKEVTALDIAKAIESLVKNISKAKESGREIKVDGTSDALLHLKEALKVGGVAQLGQAA